MKGLIQRVTQASVVVDGVTVGEIDDGILLLLGVEQNDSLETMNKLVDKVLKYRLFSDANGKMNCSLTDTGGGLLIVSQFTLVAETSKGLRPSFSAGASPDLAEELYLAFIKRAQALHGGKVATGQFAADMKVSLVNDGPVTFLLSV